MSERRLTMLGGHLLHGGDYNPEQWLDCPEILEEDIRLMKDAGVNCVTLGVFSWAVLEPEEGVYDFDWLEKIINNLGDAKIQVILATPTGALPHWLTQKYPEVMQTGADGRRNLPGRRHNFCYTSPVMREKAAALDEALSQRFGRKENVILWHISNELAGNFGDGACHCEYCQKAFREWLKTRYGTLDKLNQAWWGRFWSHVYTEWEQIHSPVPHGECTVTGLEIDWRRFVTEQISDFCGLEIRAVRRHSDLPATANFMDTFKNIDYNRLQKELDIVSWDSYPFWHREKDEVPAAVQAAFNHSMMRSMKKKPFLLMESTPSVINWRNNNPVKRPGMHMLSSMQAVAHGSDSVQYFQWRKGRGSYEKFHGAVLDHKNGSDTRTFRDVAEVGARLPGLDQVLDGTVNRPRAAVIFDWENWWAVEDITGPRLDLDYPACVIRHYRAFWEKGIEADIVDMDADLSGYDLVSAPLNYMYKPGWAEKVRAFVNAGGKFVTTYFSGMADETDLCFTGQHPLADVLGIEQEEIDAPSDEFENHFTYKGEKYPAWKMCEIVHAKETAEVISSYACDFYAGFPVVVRNSYGAGEAYYLAAESDMGFLRVFYSDIFARARLENPLGTDLPYGVTVTERSGADGKRAVFVMNFRNEPVTVSGIGMWTNAEDGTVCDGQLELKAFECAVLV